MAEGYEVSESVLREIKRGLERDRMELSNLRRQLAHVSVRRHQGVYMPSPRGVKFRNDSSEAIPPYSVMQVTGSTTDSKPLVTVNKPNTTFHRLYLVNGKKEIAANGTGYGTWLSESAYVAYNSSSGTPAYGEVWGPKPSQWTLEKYYYGFHILGGPTTIDEVPAVLAVQQIVGSVRGKTDDAHAKGATGIINLYDANGVDMSVALTGVLNSYADLEADVTADVVWQGQLPVLVAGDCQPEEA